MTKFVGSTTDIYVYDGDGQRVKKTTPAVALYWYGATGNVLDETAGNGTLVSEYIFFNGQRVARRDADNSVKYYFADNLGSASVITNDHGAMMPPLAESDYYPYGGEIPITSGDPNHYKFTGKERDTESGLDNFGARYNASSLGRFMSPDPIGIMRQKLSDPQQWNMYAYTRNNPLRFMDATGMSNTDCSTKLGRCSKKGQTQEKKDPPNQSAQNTQSATSQEAKGLGKIALGIGLVGTAAFGDAPGGVAGALILTSAVMGGTATAVSGTADVLGATTKTDVSKAQEALEATGNLPGLVTTVATGGNLKAGQTAGTLGDIASLAVSPKEAVKNVATAADSVRTLMGAKDLATSVWNSVKSYVVNPGPPTIPTPGLPQ